MAGPDMSVLIAVVTDWNNEIAAILSVFITLVFVYVVLKANRLIIYAIKGGRTSCGAYDDKLSYEDWVYFDREERIAQAEGDYDRWLRAVERRRV